MLPRRVKPRSVCSTSSKLDNCRILKQITRRKQLFFFLFFLVHGSDKQTPTGVAFQTGKCHIRLRLSGRVYVHISVCVGCNQDVSLEARQTGSLWMPLEPTSTSAEWRAGSTSAEHRVGKEPFCCCFYCPLTKGKQQVLFAYLF